MVQLPPGDADHAPARGSEAAVAEAVLLEGVRHVVCPAAVELDDDPLLWPGAVDLEFLNADVRLGSWKTGFEEQGLEALFELASDHRQALLCFPNYSFEDRDAWLARVSGDQVADPERVGEPELLGLPECAA